MTRLLYRLSGVLLVASCLVHLLTFVGVSASEHLRAVWLFHVAIFFLAVASAFTGGNSWQSRLSAESARGGFTWSCFNVPPWMKKTCAWLTVYVIGNFIFTFLYLCQGGSPSIVAGQKVLQNHGHILRELSDSDYEWQRAYVDRGFSGHWMLFSFFFLISFRDALNTREGGIEAKGASFSSRLQIER